MEAREVLVSVADHKGEEMIVDPTFLLCREVRALKKTR